MMLGLHGRANDYGVDVFRYQLALELHKLPSELDEMAYPDYLAFQAYFTAKHAIENQKPAEKGFS